VTLRARWVMLRARRVTLRARWVTLRARWVIYTAGNFKLKNKEAQVEPPSVRPPAPMDPREAMMAAIKNGPKLKPADSAQDTPPSKPKKEDPMEALSKSLRNRRSGMKDEDAQVRKPSSVGVRGV
jgi:hypothetical protein